MKFSYMWLVLVLLIAVTCNVSARDHYSEDCTCGNWHAWENGKCPDVHAVPCCHDTYEGHGHWHRQIGELICPEDPAPIPTPVLPVFKGRSGYHPFTDEKWGSAPICVQGTNYVDLASHDELSVRVIVFSPRTVDGIQVSGIRKDDEDTCDFIRFQGAGWVIVDAPYVVTEWFRVQIYSEEYNGQGIVPGFVMAVIDRETGDFLYVYRGLDLDMTFRFSGEE